jgi:hypothetical protein
MKTPKGYLTMSSNEEQLELEDQLTEAAFTEEQIAATEKQIFEHSKRIEFYLTEYSIELLASKMRNGDFEVPAYQREFTWKMNASPALLNRF